MILGVSYDTTRVNCLSRGTVFASPDANQKPYSSIHWPAAELGYVCGFTDYFFARNSRARDAFDGHSGSFFQPCNQ